MKLIFLLQCHVYLSETLNIFIIKDLLVFNLLTLIDDTRVSSITMYQNLKTSQIFFRSTGRENSYTGELLSAFYFSFTFDPNPFFHI